MGEPIQSAVLVINSNIQYYRGVAIFHIHLPLNDLLQTTARETKYIITIAIYIYLDIDIATMRYNIDEACPEISERYSLKITLY